MKVNFIKRAKIRKILKEFDPSRGGIYSCSYPLDEALKQTTVTARRAVINAETEILKITVERSHDFFRLDETNFRRQNDYIIDELIPQLVHNKDTMNEIYDKITEAFRNNVEEHFLGNNSKSLHETEQTT